MRDIIVELSPPSYWQDFEDLTLEICKDKWSDTNAKIYGRPGQEQGGIDIIGCDYNSKKREKVAVQCKKREVKLSVNAKPSSSLTKKEILAEVEALHRKGRKFDRYIIATTAKKDANLQDYVDELNDSNRYEFEIDLWFWSDFNKILNDNHNLLQKFYVNIDQYRAEYSPETHYGRFLYKVFNRPAFRTPFYCEDSLDKFNEAIIDTQQALSGGTLFNREKVILEQARMPKKRPKQISKMIRILDKIRDEVVIARQNGTITQHNDFMEVRDPRLLEDMNRMRKEIVSLANEIFEEYGTEKHDLDHY